MASATETVDQVADVEDTRDVKLDPANGSLTEPQEPDQGEPEVSEKRKHSPSKMSILKKLSFKSQKDKEKSVTMSSYLVRIDSLPQYFVTKFMGNKRTSRLTGNEAVRGPIDALSADLKKADPVHDLPLMTFKVEAQGLQMDVHKSNKSKSAETIQSVFFPIEFVSYAVQDVVHPRIFSFIVVKEMSAKSCVAHCHVHLCETAICAAKLAMSVSLAFKECAKKLESGSPFKFQVDLTESNKTDDIVSHAKSANEKDEEEEC